jgi:hypothetical protein
MNNFIKNIITSHNKKVINTFLVIVVLLVIFQWFKSKTIIAVGETGLPFYNMSRTYELSKFPYLEVQFGVPNPFYVQFRPIWGLLSIFESVGITSWILQALFFFLLINVGLLTFPHLVSKLFGNKYYFWGVVGGLFYTFNLYVLSQVWARFLYSLIFLWSLLPLMLWLWIDWVNKGSKQKLLVLILIFVLFAGIFALPSNIIVVWAIFGIYVLYSYFQTKRQKILIFRGIFGLFIWVIVSVWWLLPVYKLGNTTYSSMLKIEENMLSLKAVSKYYSNPDIFTLKQKYYFNNGGMFKDIASSNFKNAISWFVFFLVLIGVTQAKKIKNLSFIFVSLIIGWFISKGSNPPIGNMFYSNLYNISKYFEVLRNPYEKVGIMYLFAYSIFFSIGLRFLIRIFGKIKYYILAILLFLIIVYLPSPIYSARVFSKNERLNVPEDYLKLNKSLLGDGRVLHLPFQNTAGVKYIWGYAGEDPSMYLLSKPSISSPSSLNELDNFYFGLGRSLGNNNFKNMLEVTNTRYLVLHADKDLRGCTSCDLGAVEKLFDNNKDIVLVNNYGNLYLYEFRKDISGWVYGVRKYSSISDSVELENIILSNDFNGLSEIVVNDKDVETLALSSKIHTNEVQKINYIKINPVSYKIEVNNCSDSFILILVNNYNKMWQARIDGVPIQTHFKANGFSNAWLVEKKGNFSIDVNFNLFSKS